MVVVAVVAVVLAGVIALARDEGRVIARVLSPDTPLFPLVPFSAFLLLYGLGCLTTWAVLSAVSSTFRHLRSFFGAAARRDDGRGGP